MFLLLPVGHDKTELNRLPIVTFVIMGICVFIHIIQVIEVDHDRTWKAYGEIIQDYVYHFDILTMPQDMYTYMAGRGLDLDEEILKIREPLIEEALRQRERDIHIMRTQGHEVPEGAMDEPVSWLQPGDDVDEIQTKLHDNVAFLIHSPSSEINWLHKWGVINNRLSIKTLITYNFFHSGIWHLLGNLLFLYLVGTVVEDKYGRWFFGFFYMAAGICAALFNVMVYPNSGIPLVGASGAIAGAMGAFFVVAFHARIRLFYMFLIAIRGIVAVPARLFLPAFFGLDLINGLIDVDNDPLGQTGGVGYWVHVGGNLFGIIGALMIKQTGLENKLSDTVIDPKAELIAFNKEIEALRSEHRYQEAFQLAKAKAKEEPNNIDVLNTYWRQIRSVESKQDIKTIAMQIIDHFLKDDNHIGAYQIWDEAMENKRFSLPIGLLNRLAAAQAAHNENHLVVDVLERGIERIPKIPPQPLVKSVQLAVQINSPIGHQLIEKALDAPDITRDQRNLFISLANQLPANAETPAIISHDLKIIQPKIIAVTPLELGQSNITVQTQGGTTREIAYQQIRAVAVGLIREADLSPYLTVDLMIDDPEQAFAFHRVMRILSNETNIHHLIADAPNAAIAYKTLVGAILQNSDGIPLPTHDGVFGEPYTTFESMADFEQKVYQLQPVPS